MTETVSKYSPSSTHLTLSACQTISRHVLMTKVIVASECTNRMCSRVWHKVCGFSFVPTECYFLTKAPKPGRLLNLGQVIKSFPQCVRSVYELKSTLLILDWSTHIHTDTYTQIYIHYERVEKLNEKEWVRQEGECWKFSNYRTY